MTVSDSTIERPFIRARKLFLVIFIALLGAITIGVVATQAPFLAIAVLLAILLLLALIKWPDMATLLVVFYIYANVGPVAMNFYGVPSYIAMGFPVILTIPLIWYLLVRREKLVITPVFQLLLLLLVIFTLGAVFSSDITLSSRKLIDFFFEGVLLYLLLTNVIRSPLMLKRVVWVLLISGAFIGGLSLYQQATQTFDNQYGGFAQVQSDFGTGVETLQGEVVQPRLSGSIGEKNRYAQNMLMLVPLGLFQLWIYRSTWARILALLFTSLIIVGGSLAFSRGAAVGFILLILIMAFLRYIKFYQLVLLILGAYLVLWLFPQYGERIATLSVFTDVASTDSGAPLTGADGAIRGRATDIFASLLIFQDHPLIGVGPGMVQYYTQDYSRDVGFRYLTDDKQAHSLFPGIAAESGLLGLICFVLILYVALRDLVRARKQWLESHPDRSYLATAFFQVLISYIVTGLFLHLSYMRFFYLMLALAVVASSFKEADTPVETEAIETALVPGV
ncbi:MAG TPA: O-antigen ligase family protein [Anaerolineales bacterium]|nr:O-antigen ligase family protein [Anaerolineales bacterium]